MASEAKRPFAFFITPHGYGHAARAAAVMLAIRKQAPGAFFEIYTKVPAWFFQVTLLDGFAYHELYTDVGLVQDSVMEENLPGTVRRLEEMLPYDEQQIEKLADEIRAAGCEMVLCDVAPMGIAVAKAAGLPSVLEENFTWDWIYEGYMDEEPGLADPSTYLRKMFRSADLHIRTEPACAHDWTADLTTNVVGREARNPMEVTREQLGIPVEARMVLVTMGGIGSQYPFLEKLKEMPEVYFLIPGASPEHEKDENVVKIPHHSSFYHPDLVEAADLVVGKLGYSTVAEAYLAGIPYAYIPRPRFREYEPMSEFVVEKMHGVEIREERFYEGEWLGMLPELLAVPRQRPNKPNGADEIAQFLLA